MDHEFHNSRPLSIIHRTRQSHDLASTQSSLPSSPAPPPSSFFPTQRRRASAANFPPAGPPPSQPIPNLPPPSALHHLDDQPSEHLTEELSYSARQRSGTNGSQSNYGRPSVSANLATIAAFQTRQASTSASNGHHPSSSSLSHDSNPLSDASPYSAPHPTPAHHHDIVPDRLLLSPTHPRNPSQARPSSRRALTRALELAREAVQLDSTNDDPHAAVLAYGRSVALLSEVMERVRRGEDTTERTRRNGRRRSVVAQEEEVRRLKSIHDTYADRMNILSLIYSIPPIPHSPSSVYAHSNSTSTESTQPPSPASLSPTSETHKTSSYTTEHTQDEPQHVTVHDHDVEDDNDGHEGIGAALLNASYPSAEFSPRANGTSSQHPYAAPPTPLSSSNPQDQVNSTLSRATTILANRTQYTPSVTGRPRAASVFPPAPPPPVVSPPPPPESVMSASLPSQTTRFLEATRPRGNSTGHRRTGSASRLTSVTEEGVRLNGRQSRETIDDQDVTISLPRRPDTPRTAIRESHPLPPLPSPTYSVRSPELPGQVISPRVRGESMSAASGQQLINTSLAMGTIHQRRTKMSAPPSTSTSTTSSSPSDSPSQSAFSLPAPKSTGCSPVLTNSVPAIVGRNRASSQPGRRPSVVNGRISPFDPHRPPLPHTAGLNGIPRKMSNPSKLNQDISVDIPNIPQLTVQTELLSPPPALALVPPPALISNLPTTPTSPLPPAPPTDSQRKPYHMMALLADTMNSKSGGYITRRLHVPQEVWSQGGAKLTSIPEKVRVVEVLCSALEEMQQCSVDSFGASVCSGLALGIGSVTRKEAEAWVGKLEEFCSICDSIVANFGKKLGVNEGFVVKKSGGVTSWGGKLTRQIDKLTNGKNLDSPAAYVSGLSRLFILAQLIDEHTKALLSHPIAPTYAAFPFDLRVAAEVKLKRVSEFFASVVLTFVIRDLAQLLDKYAKKCEKWLAE